MLHKREIRKLIGLIAQKGYTIVPLRVYINTQGKMKVEIGVAKGKRQYDKRQTIAKKEADRRIAREMKRY